MNREVIINDLLYQIGDIVDLQFDEKGRIESMSDIPWEYRYNVRIVKSDGIFNQIGDVIQCKPDQFN